ncbi:hypothetical protein RHMOL_Rhmol04G0095000 [Rhododendron molle]|uniref:Uncharacterized protein n=1 Tax=Rhododendron molle TaxID=49168 RepID=A0ACC0NZX9_RHOML|nr:hypothetical protein RHMOL_Rhmol04G0095000 [Rhododendron molle]
MSDYIPTKLVDDILIGLPEESLIRFTSVCKSWYSIITSPSFIAKHVNHSKRCPENLLLATYISIDKRDRYLLYRGDEKLGAICWIFLVVKK